MPSNHLILCCSLLLLPSIFPSIRVFSKNGILLNHRKEWNKPGEGNGNPLQDSCLEKSMDRGAWRAAVHGVTWLSMRAEGGGRQVGSNKLVELKKKKRKKCGRADLSKRKEMWRHGKSEKRLLCKPTLFPKTKETRTSNYWSINGILTLHLLKKKKKELQVCY